jgi:hypothetical protein
LGGITMVDKERSVILVRGHHPARQPRRGVEPEAATSVGLVLSTHRSGNPDMVIDHDLWFACMEAVGAVVGANDSEVWLEPTRGFWSWFRRKNDRSSGSLDGYMNRVRANQETDDWHTIIWRKDRGIVAVATCERWYQAGGPAPYHDSYTTSVLLSRPAAGRLGAVLQVSVGRAGGIYEGVVDVRGAA